MKIINVRILSIALLLALVSKTYTWHSLGHLTVARIAEHQLSLTESGSEALNWARSLLRPMSQLCGEKYHPFSECATWPDKIKQQSWLSMFGWHFIDQELKTADYVPPQKKKIPHSQDVIGAINEASVHLSSITLDPYGHSKNLLGKSIALRNLIHFVGDIHQPLHTVSRFSKEYQNGDLGGNLFLIKRYEDPTWNNLHFVWDHLFDQGTELRSPLSEDEYVVLSDFATKLMTENPYESMRQQIEDFNHPEDWAKEGLDMATNVVYVGIVEGEELTAEYVANGRKAVNKRVALAGYRLGNMVVDIYQKYKANQANDVKGKKKKVEFIY